MTNQTSRNPTPSTPTASARASGRVRDARPRTACARAGTPARGLARARTPALATALWGALVLGVDARQARAPRPHRPASAPSTEQVLAPSAATVPDALPPARQVWRCGSSYSSQPCASADAKPLDVADPRSDAQRRQSQEVAARDKRLAAWYEAGRRQRETPASAPLPARVAAASATCVDTTTMHCVPRKPRSRTVTLPSRPGTPRAAKAGKAGNAP